MVTKDLCLANPNHVKGKPETRNKTSTDTQIIDISLNDICAYYTRNVLVRLFSFSCNVEVYSSCITYITGGQTVAHFQILVAHLPLIKISILEYFYVAQ